MAIYWSCSSLIFPTFMNIHDICSGVTFKIEFFIWVVFNLSFILHGLGSMKKFLIQKQKNFASSQTTRTQEERLASATFLFFQIGMLGGFHKLEKIIWFHMLEKMMIKTVEVNRTFQTFNWHSSCFHHLYCCIYLNILMGL